ncbi:MAG: YkvA family protein [Saprospiraceae bacterium]|jgi:uncharacterized membrane protein YkvA (DUF1232 family)|nr:YkvA family protein [Saprospiraceae bacterium]MDP4821921.1 YkvA family protein [Saprospiraceae bacterium]MDP4997972.1 YkvA family protein [Saprospiraceae bacterium]
MKIKFGDYIRFFSASNLWKKLRVYARKIGIKAVYTVLLLFYAYQRAETPSWAKNIILGVLGYFLSPIDAVPDLTPMIGYTDDIGVMSFGLVTIAAYINGDVKAQAKQKLGLWFPAYNQQDIDAIDEQL